MRAYPGGKRRSDLTRGCWSLRPSQKTATHSASRLPSSLHIACVPQEAEVHQYGEQGLARALLLDPRNVSGIMAPAVSVPPRLGDAPS